MLFIFVAIVMAVGAGLAAGLPYFVVALITSLLFGMYCMLLLYDEHNQPLVMSNNKYSQ